MASLVLWGHHLDEYQEMFDLTEQVLRGNILEYGSGPSAFNIETSPYVKHCTSCDALFNLDYPTLKTRAQLIFAEKLEEVRVHQNDYDFSRYGSFNDFVKIRQQGMDAFFEDYVQGMAENRYQAINTIALPFQDFHFDLAISSHYFFAELENQDLPFHIHAIQELARVAREVRIFPLIDRYGTLSPFVGPLLLRLQALNYGTEIRSVDYRLQPKGNAMLRVWAQQCVAISHEQAA